MCGLAVDPTSKAGCADRNTLAHINGHKTTSVTGSMVTAAVGVFLDRTILFI